MNLKEDIYKNLKSGFKQDLLYFVDFMKYIKKLPHVNHNGVNSYPIPTMEGYSFIIKNINVVNGVTIIVRSPLGLQEARKISFEDFPTFIENYKLFENKKIRKIIREQLESNFNKNLLGVNIKF